MHAEDFYSKLVVALDTPEVPRAKNLVETLGDRVQWYKLGPVLFTHSGLEMVNFLHQKKKKIFLDLKLYDTPRVVGETIRQYAQLGIHLASVHSGGGKAMLMKAAQACRGSEIRLIAITVLTSLELDEKSSLDEVLGLAALAQECRLAGILCSPHELQAVREHTLPDFLLASAGVRIPGKEVFEEDQVRVASPQEVLAWGADLFIIGRPILDAREPAEAVDALFV